MRTNGVLRGACALGVIAAVWLTSASGALVAITPAPVPSPAAQADDQAADRTAAAATGQAPASATSTTSGAAAGSTSSTSSAATPVTAEASLSQAATDSTSAAAQQAATPRLPSGFILQTIQTGLRPPSQADPGDLLADFTYLPDQSMIAIGKNGKVMWSATAATPRLLATLPVDTHQDNGLLGIALAADYRTSHVLYTTRVVPSTGPGSGTFGLLRLSRWTVTTDTSGTPTGLTGEQTVVETSADGDSHAIDTVVADQDGTLWVSIGDSSDFRVMTTAALRALDPDDLHGKLLHLRPDGTGVPTNPRYDASRPRAPRSLVYASGFRNPFRFSIDPTLGRPVVGDVGWATTEEVDVVSPGNSYGWPCWEGDHPTQSYQDLPQCAGVTTAAPLTTYPHIDGGGCVTGGVVYRGSSYPQQYRGRYFYGDYVHDKIWTLAYDAAGQLVTPPETDGFASDPGAPVKFDTVPGAGDIVFADINTATVKRLVYAPGNNPPESVITSTADPSTRTVAFDGGESSDPNGDTLTYRWDFGDGASSLTSSATVNHRFPTSPDHFVVSLTVTDQLGAADTTTTTIYPGDHPPTLTLQAPPADRTYAVGDVISASATATDPEDGPLTVHWSSLMVHCPGPTSCHHHPGEQQDGAVFQSTFEGHPGDSHLEISAIATDSKGAITTATFLVHPRQRRVTILSNDPAGFTIGDSVTSSGLFTVGMALPIVAPQTATDGAGTFDHWGDGATSRTRQLVLPDADQTITASYLTPIDRRYAQDQALRGIVGTPVDVEQGDSTVRWRVYSNGRLYWSAASGVHEVHGLIMARYLASGAQLTYGVPTTDELPSTDQLGRHNDFTGDRAIYFTPRTGAQLIRGTVLAYWLSVGAGNSKVGYPVAAEVDGGNGNHRQDFAGGVVVCRVGAVMPQQVSGGGQCTVAAVAKR